jgi:hypothetical protein
MNSKEIMKSLKNKHPDATRIGINEFRLWEVEYEDDIEIVTLTYKVDGNKFRFIGQSTVEQ